MPRADAQGDGDRVLNVPEKLFLCPTIARRQAGSSNHVQGGVQHAPGLQVPELNPVTEQVLLGDALGAGKYVLNPSEANVSRIIDMRPGLEGSHGMSKQGAIRRSITHV